MAISLVVFQDCLVSCLDYSILKYVGCVVLYFDWDLIINYIAIHY